jgi:hypothetical protein
LGSSAGEQLWVAILGSSFGEQLWTAFWTSFEAASGNSFGVSAFGSNFEEQLWGATVGSNFAALQQHWRTVALKNDSFGE